MNNDQPKTAAIAPFLSVRRGATALEFYKSAFGAIELFRIENEKGEVVARLSVSGGEFWVADESPEHANFSPESLGGGTVRMLMSVVIRTRFSRKRSSPALESFGPSPTDTDGESVGLLIHLGIIGR